MLSDQQATLNKFAPKVVFHPDEKYFPCSVDWFLQRTKLLDDQGNVVNNLNPVQNANATGATSQLADPALGERRTCTLNVLSPEQDNNPNTYGGNLSGAKCYTWVRPVMTTDGAVDAYDLNYWFFYAYNGNIFSRSALGGYFAGAMILAAATFFFTGFAALSGLLLGGITIAGIKTLIDTSKGVGLHEGDWEAMVVRVSPAGVFQKAYCFQHGDGQWVSQTDLGWTSDGHPIVYSAKFSHATYPAAKTYSRLLGVANDHTGNGQVWQTWNVLQYVGHNDKATAALQLAPPPNNSYDHGDDAPSISINNTASIVEIHRSGGSLYFNAGSYDPGTLAISWWKTNSGTKYSSSSNYTPGVALNSEDLLISVHNESNNFYYALGVLDTQKKTIDWVKTKTQFATGSSGASVALNDFGVVFSVHSTPASGRDQYLWNAGQVNDSTKEIEWWPSVDSLGVLQGTGRPGIAINDANSILVESDPNNPETPVCDLVMVVWLNQNLCYSLGEINPTNKTITWSLVNQPYAAMATPVSPQVSINNDGLVIQTYVLNSITYCNVGQIERVDNGQGGTFKTIAWKSIGTQIVTNAKESSVGLADDDTFVIVTHDGNNKYQARAGLVEVDNYSNWTPEPGQEWIKYSGHWGKQGTPPFLAIAGAKLSEVETGPIGPAYKANWVTGPDKR